MNVGIFTFSKKHGRPIERCGSSIWRGKWYVDNWPEAEYYVEGKKYDVVIFQKVWWRELYEQLDCIKVLDLCDPEWLMAGWPIVEMSYLVDAIVVASDGLYNALKPIINPDCELVWINDRVDFQQFGKGMKKQYTSDTVSKIGWFGYFGNGEKTLQQVIYSLREHDLKLKIISDNTIEYPDFEQYIENVEFNWETLPYEMLDCDLMLNPPILSPYSKYKSQNKTYLAWALGLPVATNGDELRELLDMVYLRGQSHRVYDLVRLEYDVKQSIKEYKDLIDRLWERKEK